MRRHLTLSGPDRAFFTLVARAVSTNPFTSEREEIDDRLDPVGGRRRGASILGRVERIVREVSRQLARLEAAGRADRNSYNEEDRSILEYSFLFEEYYRLAEQLDRVIEQQMETQDSVRVPFAIEALTRLRRRGFTGEAAASRFAMFFQIRRAFFFIDRALVGSSRAMRELRRSLWDNVFTSDIRRYDAHLRGRMEDFSTLFLGETGSGKGSAAAAVGRSGLIPFDEKSNAFTESFTSAFTAINLSEFPESLLESELFGHKKGAFTGAVERHDGVLARCSPFGSIFLDEIGEIGQPVQIKLLRVLEQRSFTPVGSHEKRSFRGRVVAATNRSPSELRAQGKLRDDFFYRLCSDVIHVPALRERLLQDPSELPALVRHVLERFLRVDAPDLAGSVLAAIQRQLGERYEWPGNVRELEQCVRRILLKGRYEGDPTPGFTEKVDPLVKRITECTLDSKEVLSAYCALLYKKHGSFEKAARAARLDPRTLKKHAEAGQAAHAAVR